MRLEHYDAAAKPSVAARYDAGETAVRSMFEYHYADDSALEIRARWLDGPRTAADRGRLADALRSYNEKLGGSPETLATIERLRDNRTLCVAGGQQAVLFTGPLLVVYKAISIVQAAQQAERRLGRPVVPVFWIAGEDHDFEEANHIHVLDGQLAIRKIKVDHPGGARGAVSRTAIADWSEALQQLDDLLMPTEFKPALMERLRSFAGQSVTLTELFGRIMAWLFGKHGLILIDADDPEVRRLESGMFRLLLERYETINAAVVAAHAEVASLGTRPQADAPDDAANLFLFGEDGERKLLHGKGDMLSDKKGSRTYARDELLALAETNPERFSNNVMTRPLMQDFLLPVLYVVLGPGEINYWALTKAAFAAAGLQQPIVLPRCGYTIVEGTIGRQMEKFALTLEDVADRFEERKTAWQHEQDKLGLEERFDAVREQFRAMYDPLLRTIAGINPGLGKLGETNAGKIAEQIDFLKTRALEAQLSQVEAAHRHWERIRQSLLPHGKPQERVYNVFAYLTKYGPDWLDALTAATVEPARHYTIHQ
ncbi:bacillithiol biosynthesis cysteine-adding enzyme BshC [Paenibacillus cymbidii]|uniref:bacillithiol biosynthesis cysteine-adding enzyme BshC n=1 Tax=Paenibacillus cymbidii TaxID=1639034 RepID=UPI001080695C|nr:bacillithiol biosynthesis cysteine-adding enzyme BshC [Paenibacillus cymbidii]